MLQNSNAISSDGYVIERSLRFSAASSQNLTRTPAVAGNLRKWTYSCWVKRGLISSGTQYGGLITATLNTSFNDGVYFNASSDNIVWYVSNTLSALETTAVFRDTSSWYHIVLVWDTDNATVSNRARIYVNGVEITTFTTDNRASLSARDSTFNRSLVNYVGGSSNATINFDGYMSEINFIDGQALTPSSFGEINPATGQWVAKKYTGTYGTNGFYQDFKDGTSTTTLGNDKSGNGNNWTLTNFTRSTGVNDCWMKDVPAGNGSASAVQPSGNYAVLNPLDNAGASTLTNSNLTFSRAASHGLSAKATNPLPKFGKWYFELVVTSNTSGASGIGIALVTTNVNMVTGVPNVGEYGTYMYPGSNTLANSNNSSVIFNNSISPITGTVLQIAADCDNGAIWIGVNNVWSDGTVSGTTGNPSTGNNPTLYVSPIGLFPVGRAYANGGSLNFGQRSFAYTPPTGFKALCTANLPAPSVVKPSNHFNVSLWTGNRASSRAITGLNFSPDFTWIRCRSKNYSNHLVDSVRGPTNSLSAASTNAQVANSSSGYVSSLDSNGFTVNFGTLDGWNVNEDSQTYVAWNWRASESTPVTNTDGSITSTVSSNPAAGFSIVTYTGTGANATVGHGLGITPSVIMVKNATFNATYWCVKHNSLTAPSVLRLNDVTAAASATNIWSLSIDTSLVFSVGAANETNRPTHTMVAYCFAEIAGYSKFGSYIGNGSVDGTFVYLGFSPAFVMIKRTDTTSNWTIFDNRRSGYNIDNDQLYANTDTSEVTTNLLDLNSNGFKLRSTGASPVNASGGTYIYMAFAETSMTYSNAR